MTRASRKRVKERCARVHKHLGLAADALAVLKTEFTEHHPDLAQEIDQMGVAVLMLQEVVEAFWVKCWGKLPSKWETYY